MEYKNPISNIEWALVISAMATIDIVELALAWGLDAAFGLGSLSDAFIDIPVFLTWTSYLFLRAGIKPDWKKVMTTIAGFLGEEADGGGFPLWTLDALAVFALQKVDENAAKFGMIGELAAQAIKQYAEEEGATGAPAGKESGETETESAENVASERGRLDMLNDGSYPQNPKISASSLSPLKDIPKDPSNLINLRDQFKSPQNPENTVDLRKNTDNSGQQNSAERLAA